MTIIGEFMIKRIVTVIVAIIMIGTGCALIAQSQELDVNITSDDTSISVTENIQFEAISGDFLEFWIQNGATDISIIISGDSVDYESIGNNRYSSNVSSYITDEDSLDITVTYKLDKYTTKFEKTIIYNLSLLEITFDGKEIYSGTNLKSESTINVALQKEIEEKTITVETIPTWTYIIIIVLIILLIIVLITSAKKPKSKTKKEGVGGSEELLATKKSLLMETLKEIEKRHRGKQISDDTYHKLKGEFKQDAVEAMKQLEDLKK